MCCLVWDYRICSTSCFPWEVSIYIDLWGHLSQTDMSRWMKEMLHAQVGYIIVPELVWRFNYRSAIFRTRRAMPQTQLGDCERGWTEVLKVVPRRVSGLIMPVPHGQSYGRQSAASWKCHLVSIPHRVQRKGLYCALYRLLLNPCWSVT